MTSDVQLRPMRYEAMTQIAKRPHGKAILALVTGIDKLYIGLGSLLITTARTAPG